MSNYSRFPKFISLKHQILTPVPGSFGLNILHLVGLRELILFLLS